MRKLQIATILIAAASLIVIFRISGLLKPIESSIRVVLLPVARIASAIGFEIGINADPELDPVKQRDRINELESRVSSMSVDYVKLRALEEENVALRKMTSFLSESGYDHVSARVIVRSTDPQTATVMIDRGARDGLEIGMAVVAEDGIFVGKIITLNERVSTVLLVADPRSRLAASLSGKRELIGMVEGDGNGVANLIFVPQSKSLSRDDVIVTAGTEEKIPANLAIALVNKVLGKQTDPFKTASLEPLAHINKLDMVIILRPTVLRPS